LVALVIAIPGIDNNSFKSVVAKEKFL